MMCSPPPEVGMRGEERGRQKSEATAKIEEGEGGGEREKERELRSGIEDRRSGRGRKARSLSALP